MDISLIEQMSAKVVNFLLRQINVSEFHDWFIPATWDIDDESEEVKRFAHRVQLVLAEFSNGDRTEDEAREAIQDFLNPQSRTLTVTITVGEISKVSARRSKDLMKETQVGQRVAGTLFAVAPAL